MKPILLNWGANTYCGWGLAGLNVFLQWANDPEIRALMGAPIGEQDLLGLDSLKINACAEAIIASNRFQNELRQIQGGGGRIPFTVIEGLGNGLFRPNWLNGTRTVGRCIFEDTKLDSLDGKLA